MMKTLILPFSENDVDILNFINRLRLQKKSFRIETAKYIDDDPNIVWAISEPDPDWEKLGLSSLAEDWDGEEDNHWNEFYEQTKPTMDL